MIARDYWRLLRDVACVSHLPASLIELLAEVLDAEQSLFGKKVRPLEDWLKRYLKVGHVDIMWISCDAPCETVANMCMCCETEVVTNANVM